MPTSPLSPLSWPVREIARLERGGLVPGDVVITRIYIDNFRTLVNFEWKPGKLALLLGENGSGKSSVIDALWGIRALVAEQGELRRWFPGVSRARVGR
ncbi:AAA family ATPase [Sorangium sp. So ce426]|uniref:AAA family ATPase n=1 Tax=unclassified Sorangium TaxID=2621164 RepID=UPI003F5B1A14